MAHQVTPKGNLAGFVSCRVQNILQYHGIKHDVAVVGDKKIGFLLADVLYPRPVELCGGLLQQLFKEVL